MVDELAGVNVSLLVERHRRSSAGHGDLSHEPPAGGQDLDAAVGRIIHPQPSLAVQRDAAGEPEAPRLGTARAPLLEELAAGGKLQHPAAGEIGDIDATVLV